MFEKKYSEGKTLRTKTPRSTQASWKQPPKRPSVLKMIQLSNYDRLPDLIPIRHARMSKSPFAFYRGTASLMARDLSFTSSSGITVQACGDCHLMNFGGFATPERNLVVDINDFDETNQGPWEWDLKRLATSFVLAAREKGFDANDAQEIVINLVSSYQDSLKNFASMELLDFWYMKFDVDQLEREAKDRWMKQRFAKEIDKANSQTVDKEFYKITSSDSGKYKISDQPPLIQHPADMDGHMNIINAFMLQYKKTLLPDRRWLFEQYEVVDVVLKVVGVGSVGTRCYVVLLMNDNKEPLLIQIKEARESVLAPYTGEGKYRHNGERVVQGQRLIQTASDIFLGWGTGPGGRQYYFRQLRDKKLALQIEEFDKFLLTAQAKLCGRILARAHCKTGKGATICGYIGKGGALARAISAFAAAYADQTEKDYNDFIKAIHNGKLPMAQG
jgi:uncharacterized protein (DUF2252 family)